MERNKLFAAGALIVLVILIFIFIDRAAPETEPYFTDEPETWVEEDPGTPTQDIRVNVQKATEMESSITGNRQEYVVDGDLYAFFSTGVYQGNTFDIAYLDEEGMQMKISPVLTPGDGIIDGFIMARRADRGYTFYTYVDDDWRQTLSETFIVYGRDFSKTNLLTQKTFQFEQVSPGIYMQVIEDARWYDQNPVKGGLIVGELTTQDMQLGIMNKTYMMLR